MKYLDKLIGLVSFLLSLFIANKKGKQEGKKEAIEIMRYSYEHANNELQKKNEKNNKIANDLNLDDIDSVVQRSFKRKTDSSNKK